MDTPTTITTVLMSVFGSGGVTAAIVRALWKRHEADLAAQLVMTREQRDAAQQTIAKLEGVIKELQSDIDALLGEVRRVNDLRLDQAERRGNDNAESLLDVVRVLDEVNRVLRDIVTVMGNLERWFRNEQPSGRGKKNV